MRKLLLYILIIFILFSAFSQVKESWEKTGKSFDATYAELQKKISGWFQTASGTGKVLKEKLQNSVEETAAKYQKIKNDIELVNKAIQEKKNQLETTLKEMEQTKKSLEKLLNQEKEEESKTETTSKVSTEGTTPEGK